jgi:uncharacterized protein (DUF433 family)
MNKKQLNYKDRIITDPQSMVGKLVVRRTRIPVEHVLGRLAENLDLDGLFAMPWAIGRCSLAPSCRR